jgi:hypothetical protein
MMILDAAAFGSRFATPDLPQKLGHVSLAIVISVTSCASPVMSVNKPQYMLATPFSITTKP